MKNDEHVANEKGKSYEGVIEAVRVWDEGEQYASVEWASDTINNVEEK